MSFQRNTNRLLWACTVLTLLTPSSSVKAQDSIIVRIQSVMPSIVEISVQNAVLMRVPGGSFIDASTGSLMQIDSVKAAEYSRHGSGVIIDPSGIIVTNAHTVDQGARITITFIDGTKLLARPLKIISHEDLAFLKIDPPYPLTRVDIAPSAGVRFDEEVVTVGSSPFLSQTLSGGRITGMATRGNPYTSHPIDLFQLNINIYPGDSGGPLFNHRGQLVGLMVAKQADEDRVSFAIPSDKIIKSYIELMEEFQKKAHD